MNSFSRIRNIAVLFVLVAATVAAHGAGTPTTDTIKIRNFVVKTYISLLNRKPDKAEIQSVITKYSLFNELQKGQELLVRDLLKSKEFSHSVFDLFKNEFLQGVDVDEINTQITDYRFLLTIKTQSDFADIFQYELNRFLELRGAEDQYIAGKIKYNDFQKTFFNNKFFDDINMGDNNFVIACFNYLFYRNPTKYELEEGKKLYNNQFGVMFCKPGSSKIDFLEILFKSNEWKVGNIRFWFNKLLNRNPTHDELVDLIRYAGDPAQLIERIILKK
jgi:hypothetical protein